MFNQILFRQMIGEKFVSERKHPTADLFIYNYTAKAQYDWTWNEVTTQCRGLILDSQGNVIAKPFRKFFSLEQLESLPDINIPLLPFEVFDKLDGSLGVLYFIDDTPYIATRGSFESEQAIKGTEILHTKYSHVQFEKNKTYLFEIIFPGNRIVIDYGAIEDLILLTVIDNGTGEESLPEMGLPVIKRFDGLHDLSVLKTLEEDNREGFVVRFSDGFRLKVKFEEYKRLHKLVTQVSNVVIWEHLKDGLPFTELIDRVPDEFFAWLEQTKNAIVSSYNLILYECEHVFKVLETRKDTALYYQTQKYPHVLFAMMDNKDLAPIIWKMVKPKWTQPFKTDEV